MWRRISSILASSRGKLLNPPALSSRPPLPLSISPPSVSPPLPSSPAVGAPPAPLTVLEDLRLLYHEKATHEPTTRLPRIHHNITEFEKSASRNPLSDTMSRRVAVSALRELSNPTNLRGLGGTVCGVFFLGSVEAVQLLSADLSSIVSSLDNLSFVCHYGLNSILPSCTWHTLDPKLVAEALGLPSDVLQTPLPPSTSFAVLQIATVRHLVATSALFRQLFRVSSVTLRARQEYSKGIENGDVPPLACVKEKVVRLGGSKSDVTVVSLDRYADHLLPVYEDPSKVKYLVKRHSQKHTVPVYWRVAAQNYGHPRGWDNLHISPDWLLQTTIPGRLILVCEADLVNDEDSLSLAPAAARDLTIGQTTEAFRRIVARARECMGGETQFRVLRVVLGDSMELFTSGGGHSSTLRERVLRGKEADVLVDCRAPVWLEVLESLEKLVKGAGAEEEGELRRVWLFTDSKEYFQNLEQFCRRFGFEIVDGFAELNKAQEKPRREGGEEQRKAAAFVCFSSTASSITHTLMLYNVGIQKHVEGVVSLVDKVAGRDQLEAENRGGELAGLEVVCSSIIHDELFKSVRIWSRMGFSGGAIQEELDFRFARILEAETAITIEHEQDEQGAVRRRELEGEEKREREKGRAEREELGGGGGRGA
ncbi:hypothetical protein TeGR_g13704, partial [Tetraparma gracilis]